MSTSTSSSASLASSQSSSVWLYDKPLSLIHRFCFYILRWGPVPNHLAIVMDGNRRYAKKNGVDKVEGHQGGFTKLTETLQWCLSLNIMEVTVFVFSIENFKRSEDEVNKLMDLAREKFRALIDEWQKLKEQGICIRVIGNLTLLPKDLITLILISMLLTKNNKRAFLNMAFSYTGKEELITTSSHIVYGLRNKTLQESDVSENLFDHCLYTYQSPTPELVIRTSGQTRLSDFLTWQSCQSYFHFVDVLWPDFSAWNLMNAVFCYQHFMGKLKLSQKRYASTTENSRQFIDNMRNERTRILLDMTSSNGSAVDWKKLNSASEHRIYEYYVSHIKNKSGESVKT